MSFIKFLVEATGKSEATCKLYSSGALKPQPDMIEKLYLEHGVHPMTWFDKEKFKRTKKKYR